MKVRRCSLRRLLVIGDDRDFIESAGLDDALVERVDWRAGPDAALSAAGIDLVVPVVPRFDHLSHTFFESLAAARRRPPVLAVFPIGSFDSDQFAFAVSAVDDFVMSPVRVEEWRGRVERLTGSRTEETDAVEKLAATMALVQFVGRAPAFLDVVQNVPRVARSGSPALITGETGTGKELCARAIHFMSPRRNEPFIPVDCGGLPDNLFENELFGHVRGAFTDAHRDQRGLIALAEGGTLFLDEVDSLSMAAQAKLLRFLQERTYRPLGSERFLRANVNVLAAMNRDPEALVRESSFRADLFFRLNVVRLHLAPLRERLSDIPLLARHFVASFATECELGPKTISPAVIPKLLAYDWPGNVRELGNVIHRAVVLAPDRHVLPQHVVLPQEAARPSPPTTEADDTVSFRSGRSRAIEEFERAYVTRLFEKHGGNVTRAAREAQKDRRAFGRLLKKHGVRTPNAAAV